MKSIKKLKGRRHLDTKFITPEGPKSLGGSYDVNFHCDFLKCFWRYKNLLAFWGCNFFCTKSLEKKLCCPKHFSLIVRAATSTPEKLPKNYEFFFL
jgi:hypothetical protein